MESRLRKFRPGGNNRSNRDTRYHRAGRASFLLDAHLGRIFVILLTGRNRRHTDPKGIACYLFLFCRRQAKLLGVSLLIVKLSFVLKILNRFRQKLSQACFDIRSGVYTGGIRPSRYSALGANETVSTSLRVLPVLFDQILVKDDVFVDVGCGRGRVLHWVLRDGRASAVYGIELDKRVAAITARSLDKYLNATVVAGNVLTAIPDDATLMYLWNPFNAEIMMKFKEAVITKYKKLDRLHQLRIVYHNALYSGVFEDDDGCQVRQIPLPAWEHHQAILVTFKRVDSGSEPSKQEKDLVAVD